MKVKQFNPGDRVKILDGIFKGREARVTSVNQSSDAVRIETTISGKPVPVEFMSSELGMLEIVED